MVYLFVISVPRKVSHENSKLKVTLIYIARPCLKMNKQMHYQVNLRIRIHFDAPIT